MFADFVNSSSFQNQCQVDAKKAVICILLLHNKRSPDARHGGAELIFTQLVFRLALAGSFLDPFPFLHFGMRMFILGHCIYFMGAHSYHESQKRLFAFQ